MNVLVIGLLLTVAPPSGTMTVDATCQGATITTAGWPDETLVVFGLGNSPPGGPPVNGTMFWPAQLTEPTNWSIEVQPPSSPAVFVQGVVDCAPVQVTEPVAALEPAVVPAVLDLSPWVNVELAPPW